MNWRQKLANWITQGELQFHQEAAVKALAEAQGWRETADHMEELYEKWIDKALDEQDKRIKAIEELRKLTK